MVERSVKPRQVKAWPHDVSHSEEGGQRTDEEVLGGEASWEEEITDADMSLILEREVEENLDG